MSTLNDIGIPGVGTGGLQPMQKHLFKVTFSNFGGGVDTQPLSLMIMTATLPNIDFEEIQLDRYNSRVYIPGKHTFDPMTITVQEDLASGVGRAIQAQMDRQKLLIGAAGQFLATSPDGSSLKFKTLIDLLDGNQTVLATWVYEGCWIKTLDHQELDYAAGADTVIYTMTVRYDMASRLFGTVTAPGTAF